MKEFYEYKYYHSQKVYSHTGKITNSNHGENSIEKVITDTIVEYAHVIYEKGVNKNRKTTK